MKKFNCVTLELTVNFDQEVFKTEEFLRDIKAPKSPPKSFTYFYGSKDPKRKEHAHLDIRLSGPHSAFRLVFHPSDTQQPDTREPYVEDVASWLGGFFKTDVFDPRITARYDFSKKYEPIVTLSYPFLINSSLFDGTRISGYEIDFPDGAQLQKAVISATDKMITVLLYSHLRMIFREFTYGEMVIAFSEYALALVRKKDKPNGK